MKSICFLALLFMIGSCGSDSQIITPEVKPLVEAVYASGFITARNQYTVYAQGDGQVAEKVVDDGANVRDGQALLILESDQTSSRFDLARKNYAIALQNSREGSPVLSEALSAMRLSESRMRHDSINFVRFENLWNRKATTKAEYDRARLAYSVARDEHALQESRYDRVKTQTDLELENARNQLAIAADESGKHIVRSEIDGMVFKLMKEEGELVRRGEAVAIIGDSSEFFLELAIDELDVDRVKKGQEVVVTIDAFPGRMFKAEIEKIYPIVNQQQQSIRVDAVLKDQLPSFYSGLSVEANIIIRKNDRALVIPRKALHAGDSLVIQTDDGVKKVGVKTGIKTVEEAEILEGISAKSEIIVNDL